MTVTAITPSILQILVISSCDQYYPLKKLTAHNLATRILDLGVRKPLERLGIEHPVGGLVFEDLYRYLHKNQTKNRLVLVQAFSLSWQPKMLSLGLNCLKAEFDDVFNSQEPQRDDTSLSFPQRSHQILSVSTPKSQNMTAE
jgi:hypothetical protein